MDCVVFRDEVKFLYVEIASFQFVKIFLAVSEEHNFSISGANPKIEFCT